MKLIHFGLQTLSLPLPTRGIMSGSQFAPAMIKRMTMAAS